MEFAIVDLTQTLPATSLDEHLMLKLEVGRQVGDVVEVHTLERVPTPIARRFCSNLEAAGWATNVQVALPQ